jgi:hypothetical protein
LSHRCPRRAPIRGCAASLPFGSSAAARGDYGGISKIKLYSEKIKHIQKNKKIYSKNSGK